MRVSARTSQAQGQFEMPLFSGDAMMAMGSLIGHMVFGAVLGAVYGEAGEAVRAAA